MVVVVVEREVVVLCVLEEVCLVVVEEEVYKVSWHALCVVEVNLVEGGVVTLFLVAIKKIPGLQTAEACVL